MKRLITDISGPLGILILGSAILSYAFSTSDTRWLFYGKLAVGLLCLVTYGIKHRSNLTKGFLSSYSLLRNITFIIIFMAVVIFILFNLLIQQQSYYIDLTKQNIHSLQPASEEILKNVTEPIEIIGFYPANNGLGMILKRRMDVISAYQSNIHYRIVDPDLEPQLVKEYGILPKGKKIVITNGHKTIKVANPDEYSLIAAIKTFYSKTKKVYFLQGHGEAKLNEEHASGYSLLHQLLSQEGLLTEPLSLVTQEAFVHDMSESTEKNKQKNFQLTIPDDADMLVIAGNKGTLFEPEIYAIEKYLEQGGRLLVGAEWTATSGLEELLQKWGITITKMLMVDSTIMNRPFLVVGSRYNQEHPITMDRSQISEMSSIGSKVTMQTALALGRTNPQTITTVTEIVQSSANAYGETQPQQSSLIKYNAHVDMKGPLPLVMSSYTATKPIQDQTRIIVCGDWEFMNNQYLQTYGNKDFTLKTFAWLTQDDEGYVFRSYKRPASRLYMTGAQASIVGFLLLDAIPVIILALGLIFVHVRRSR